MQHRVMQNLEVETIDCTGLVVNDSPYALAVLNDSPTAYWQCQELNVIGALPLDTSGNGWHMTTRFENWTFRNQQEPGPLTSQCNYGMTMDGNPLGGIVPNTSRPVFSTATASWTWEWWVSSLLVNWCNAFQPAFFRTGDGFSNGYWIKLHSIPTYEPRIEVWSWGPSQQSAASALITTDEWHHLAVVCDSGNLRVLHQGVFLSSLGSIVPPSAPTGVMNLEIDYQTAIPTTPNIIEHIAYWDHALTDAQIATHYYAR